MRVLGSLALLSAALVQGEWTEDMGAELRMLQASNSSNSSSSAGGQTSTSSGNATSSSPAASSSSPASSPSGNSSATSSSGVSGGGGSSSAASSNSNTTSTTTTTTSTTTTTTAGNTTTTTTTTVAGATLVTTSATVSIANISAAPAAAKRDFSKSLGSQAVTKLCENTGSDWTTADCTAASAYTVTIGVDGTDASMLTYTAASTRRQLGAHNAKDVVKTVIESQVPTAKVTSVKTAVKAVETSGALAAAVKTIVVATQNQYSAALGMSNITASDVTVTVAAEAPPTPSTSGASSISALFTFVVASVAAAIFMF